MKKEQIKIGEKVWFYPILGEDEREPAVITSDVKNVCGEDCCFIDCRRCVVSIENLTPRL